MFSPNRQQPDVKKPAWERLIERSFDPKTAQFMKNYKQAQKSLDQQHSKNLHKAYNTQAIAERAADYEAKDVDSSCKNIKVSSQKQSDTFKDIGSPRNERV